MDVASQIAVMNSARIEQVGSPTTLYDEPATEFAMQFVGEPNRIGDRFVRPHDLEITLDPAGGGVETMVDRITQFGFDVRVELTPAGGDQLLAQLTRDRLDELELERGQIVRVTPANEHTFARREAAARAG